MAEKRRTNCLVPRSESKTKVGGRTSQSALDAPDANFGVTLLNDDMHADRVSKNLTKTAFPEHVSWGVASFIGLEN